MQKILFIGHEASRTGAPILMLQFLRWLNRSAARCHADVLLLRGGELEPEIGEVANVTLADATGRRKRRIRRLGERLGVVRRNDAGVAPIRKHYDLVVGNTVQALPELARFKRKGMRTLAWVHELDYAVGEYSDERFLELCQQVDRFMVVSEAVADMLRRRGVTRTIDVVHGFPKPPGPIGDAADIRQRFGIPSDAFLVGGCGTIEWRKGVDLFLHVARHLVQEADDIFFLWVGGSISHANLEFRRIRHDLARLEIGDRVIFSGAQENAESCISAMDVFALTSREDSFPLVCLEAASVEKPIVCFAKAGGAAELVGSDAGTVVPYGDTQAFSRTILRYRDDGLEARRAGKAARAKVETRFSMEVACPKIWNVLRRAADQSAGFEGSVPCRSMQPHLPNNL